MRLYNTTSSQIEDINPLKPPVITFYSCGPTVYDYTHIGHLRTYINNDILKRVLTTQGYRVKHVMNITDVGHLTGDDDSGEDKLEKGAKKTGKTVWEVARFYTDYFLKAIEAVNILKPDQLVKATDHIGDMIALIEILVKKGYGYETNEAVYFDLPKFKKYGQLSKQNLADKTIASREGVYVDPNKKHPADFALWFKKVGRFKNHQMHWDSPWGEGFPGWHIECSAMSMKYLGETIDIHAGGIDHIAVHHENEIAQSEAATGKQFVNNWFHNNFLLVEGEKMSKSLGNIVTLENLQEKKLDPLSLRYLCLQTHYRQLQNFTWESITAAQQTCNRLIDIVRQLRKQSNRANLSEEKLQKVSEYKKAFDKALLNDLQIPQALAILWEMLKSNIPSTDKLDLLYVFDEVLGLKLREIQEEVIPQEIISLAQKREEARKNKDFTASDIFRDRIVAGGYTIEDLDTGFRVKKK